MNKKFFIFPLTILLLCTGCGQTTSSTNITTISNISSEISSMQDSYNTSSGTETEVSSSSTVSNQDTMSDILVLDNDGSYGIVLADTSIDLLPYMESGVGGTEGHGNFYAVKMVIQQDADSVVESLIEELCGKPVDAENAPTMPEGYQICYLCNGDRLTNDIPSPTFFFLKKENGILYVCVNGTLPMEDNTGISTANATILSRKLGTKIDEAILTSQGLVEKGIGLITSIENIETFEDKGIYSFSIVDANQKHCRVWIREDGLIERFLDMDKKVLMQSN